MLCVYMHAKKCQSQDDEAQHAHMAHNYGATDLPTPIKLLMQASSKLMTKTTYYI